MRVKKRESSRRGRRNLPTFLSVAHSILTQLEGPNITATALSSVSRKCHPWPVAARDDCKGNCAESLKDCGSVEVVVTQPQTMTYL